VRWCNKLEHAPHHLVHQTPKPALHIHEFSPPRNAKASPAQVRWLPRLRSGDQAGMSHSHYEVPVDLTAVLWNTSKPETGAGMTILSEQASDKAF